MKSILRERTLLLVAGVIGLIWKHMFIHGWPSTCAVMVALADLEGALCFEAQAESHYRKDEGEKMNWFAWQFWLTRARIWRAACKVLERLGFADMPF